MSEEAKVVEVSSLGLNLGEGPHWDPLLQALLFTDINSADLYRLFPASGRVQRLHLDHGEGKTTVSFVIPVEGLPDHYVVGLSLNLAIIEWSVDDPDQHTVKPKVVLHSLDNLSYRSVTNDAKCDPRGRLWAGTVSYDANDEFDKEKGFLYRLDKQLVLSKWLKELSCANGLAWTGDRSTFYYIDSFTQRIDAFNYDDATGDISERRTAFNFKDSPGLKDCLPDGMCIDAHDNLWVACFYGSKVICVDPRAGKLLREVKLPTANITSVCWGGPDLSTLYVTSAKALLKPEDLAAQPSAGNLFKIEGLGVKGLPAVNFQPDLEVLKSKM